MTEKEYYCDGKCESCDKGKLFEGKKTRWYTCDPEKVIGLKVIAPKPPIWCDDINEPFQAK